MKSSRKPATPNRRSQSDGSAARLKAEIGALKDKRAKRWWHDSPNNGDLQDVLVLLDKLATVTEKLERRMPLNDQAKP